ncbi:beta-galactosidase [Halobacteroides halobius DSM 5150]|uniref:Beta-galactosidase n=1 Tax=Halobacteroides halobius (strain ATCC 35273 / DSM 5150 / MD-1) TaxID=748449 RepID=L0KB15_HALHC|nr:beta-galactosidase [Halobacteroides halobius]AGB41273.1 beta-galactosidase [Halobacteroides halobius DSM 5150]
MYFGVDYYPEHWPEERWETDIKMMKELGINVVRIAEFGWSVIEPKEGQYNFSLYDKVIDLLHQYDIDVILGTPTATPPAWLIEKHPNILQINKQGQRNNFGGRRHYCFNNLNYQRYTHKIVTQMVEHYNDNEAVIGWQIDNEFGHEASDKCYCDDCQKEFQNWLKEKYSTLENLNQTWGTVFWSQSYNSWDQIPTPKETWTAHNPSLLLDFYRFSSDSIVDYQKMQVDIIREKVAEQWITHNLIFTGHTLNLDNLARDLDFVSFDNYPVWGGLAKPVNPETTAFNHDLMYGLKNQPFWIMEELIGAQGWDQIGYLPRPNQAKMWTYQALGHGAEAIIFFRWRACRFGTEQFCHGILDHDGKPKRKYKEIKEIKEELDLAGDDFTNSTRKAKVALYHSYDNMWAWQIQPQSSAFDYREEVEKIYRPFFNKNINVNVISQLSNLEQYEILVLPILFLVNSDWIKEIESFVTNGGKLVLTYRNGVKDENNIVTDKTLPGFFSELAGIEINEYESLQVNQQNSVVFENKEYDTRVWSDLITLTGAKSLAEYNQNFYAGTPAITENKYGQGEVYYIGCSPDDKLLSYLYERILIKTSLNAIETEKGVEIIKKTGEKNNYLIALNHNSQSYKINLSKTYKTIDGKQAKTELQLQPFDGIILKQDI